jgi:hypothetical protein
VTDDAQGTPQSAPEVPGRPRARNPAAGAKAGTCARCGSPGAHPCPVYAAVAEGMPDLCPRCDREVHAAARRVLGGARSSPSPP